MPLTEPGLVAPSLHPTATADPPVPKPAQPAYSNPPATGSRAAPRRARYRPSRVVWAVVGLAGLLLLAFILVLLPAVVEKVAYAVTRGQQYARADVARERLAVLLHGGPSDGTPVYRLMAQSIAPSVVSIRARRPPHGGAVDRGAPIDEGSYATGQGAGVIVDPAGYIVTNDHVVRRASEVLVELADGRVVSQAKVVGSDPLTDLAVLKIDAPNLAAAPWGDSDAVEVGDPVLAVGDPFGLTRTVTAGIVSAKGRHGVVKSLDYQDFLQTDAVVNPGSSGGPLVDLRGEVVGINTAIVGDAYQGITFAIPSRLAREVYQKLRATGRIARGWIGVVMADVDAEVAQSVGIDQQSGVLVVGVLPGSPARKASLAVGDVILKWNGQDVNGPRALLHAVANTPVQSEAHLEIIRAGEITTVAITVGERPARFDQVP